MYIFVTMKSEKKKATSKPAVPTPVVSKPVETQPTPFDIAMFAEQEDDRKPAETHIRAIMILRDSKNFSFREIAEWLQGFGVKVDSNAIYRAYMNKSMEYCSSQEELDEIAREANAEMKTEEK